MFLEVLQLFGQGTKELHTFHLHSYLMTSCIFTQSNKGILTSLNATTGEAIIERTRLPDIQNIYASPVGANGHVYFAGRTGAIVVLKHTNELNVVATNKLDDEFNASPVPVGDCLYLRGRQYLYCIGETKNN